MVVLPLRFAPAMAMLDNLRDAGTSGRQALATVARAMDADQVICASKPEQKQLKWEDSFRTTPRKRN